MSGSTDPSYRVGQRYVCRDCGTPSNVDVHPSDMENSIRVACGGPCEGATRHDPAGATDGFGRRNDE